MIDTLEATRKKAAKLDVEDIIKRNLLAGSNLNIAEPETGNYALMTLHRPSNVDKKEVLEPIINFLRNEITDYIKILWPLHPRTMKKLKDFHLFETIINKKNVVLLEPLGYVEMLRLNMGAKIMLTDSGGLQEECTVLGTPCLTLRWNTERPITLKEHGGTSVLVGNNVDRIRTEFKIAIKKTRRAHHPNLWDGKTAERCLETILEYYKKFC